MSVSTLGLQMCTTSILTGLAFCSGNPIQVLQALYTLTISAVHGHTFLTVKLYSSDLIDRK